MKRPGVTLYVDVKSPYAYLAKEPAYAFEESGVEIDWLPYTIDIPAYLGTVVGRNAHQWRRTRYSYMDCRRLANRRMPPLVIRGPQKIFDSRAANTGILYAKAARVLRPYLDLVFERFFNRELDIEDPLALASILGQAGADARGFADYVEGEGRQALERIQDDAEAAGVFGVPTFVVDGEVYWGSERLDLVRERLRLGNP